MLHSLIQWVYFGHYAVGVFIVLSGYCLMLPVLKSEDGKLPNGFLHYIKRRTRRILPPYFASLLLSWVLILISLKLPGGGDKHELMHNISPGVVLSHLLVIHNLNPEWATAVNAPLWSVATEWQIYFLFPLILLPLFRKFSGLVTVVAGYVIGILPRQFLHGAINLDSACFWYLGLFALGMLAASIGNRLKTNEPSRTPWGTIAIVLTVFMVTWAWLQPMMFHAAYFWLTDPFIGLITFCLLIHCTLQAKMPVQNSVTKFLSSKQMVALGSFSYSLYLTHRLVQFKLFYVFEKMHLSPTFAFAGMICLGIPMVIGFAWVFYQLVERRFLNTSK